MTAEEFLDLENWEDLLVQRRKNKATTEEDHEEPQEQEPVLRLKTHSATLDSLIQSEMFGMEKSMAWYPQKVQGILQQYVIYVKCQAKLWPVVINIY